MTATAPATSELPMRKVKKRIKVAVRALASRVLRAGDLDLESFGAGSPVDGIRAHQRVQASRGDDYRKEVAVNHLVEDEHFILEVSGRIDGVVEAGGETVVEEIKTTREELDTVAARDDPTHWGQLRVYAYLYALEHGLAQVATRLTYYQLDTETTRSVEVSATREELGSFFDDLVERYLCWARRIEDQRRVRDRSIRTTSFPFPSYRRGQRGLAVQVYRAIEESGQLLVRAPTGIGKTMATLFPSIKALGTQAAERVFYLTARTTGKALAESAVRELSASGLRLKSVTLTAKDAICFNPERACNGEECEFARGFYDRIDEALEELSRADDFSRERVEAVARTHRVCPFELSLELALAADLIICDYNYVFDPRVRLKRLFAEREAADVLLIDEAHNLLERARDMYSAELRMRDVVNTRKSLDARRERALARSLNQIRGALVDAREENPRARARPEAPSPLLATLRGFIGEAERFLAARDPGHPASQLVLELFFAASRFVSVAEDYDDRYVTCYEPRGTDFRVKLFCTDPASGLSETLSAAKASVFFSATLIPLGFHLETLGCRDDAKAYALESPFPPDNVAVLVADRIATRFTERERTRGDLARMLAAFAGHRPGNYLVYFPSYEYLEAVRAELVEGESLEPIVQKPGMSEAERSAFLARFRQRSESTLVGLAVMGGFFGEGIDLVGDRLEGVAIVGVGLPGISPERDQIRERYQRTTGAGYDFAYGFPGWNRVLQAAGRLIRSETDRGAVLLIDQRLGEARYRRWMPREWTPETVEDEAALARALDRFWSRAPARSR